jgi:hypothetical protein
VFRHVDTLLQVLENAESGRNEGLFPDYTPDLAPAEISALMTFVSELRAKMPDKLTAYGFGPTAPKTTAKHAAHSTLTFITIAVDELRPRNVRGYGELTEKAARERIQQKEHPDEIRNDCGRRERRSDRSIRARELCR